MTSGARPLSDDELTQLEDLGDRVIKLTDRRSAMRDDLIELKVVASGGTPTGHTVFVTIKSLGSQILSLERRIDRILDRSVWLA